MAQYSVQTFRRKQDGSAALVDVALFEAASLEVATMEALRHGLRAGGAHYAVLIGPDGKQISTLDLT